MNLEVVHEDAWHLAQHDQDEFRRIRQATFGASDSSVVLGVNPFADNTIDELYAQKTSPIRTKNEERISKMVSVRKGSDLEPLIMDKFTQLFTDEVGGILKPRPMFRFKDYPYLSVNFDGIIMAPERDWNHAPCEIKYISPYGAKYYDFTKCIKSLAEQVQVPVSTETNFGKYCLDMASQTGLPVYYYTQVQQQLMGLDAPYGYLAALNDKDWELYVWKVYRDCRVQDELQLRGYNIQRDFERRKSVDKMLSK